MRLDVWEDRVTLYSRAFREFGDTSQMRMCQEECGELIAAINQFLRGRISERELAEEVADVRIMVEQMELYLWLFGKRDACVVDIVEEKLERLWCLLAYDKKGDGVRENGPS